MLSKEQVLEIRKDFPYLNLKINDRPIVYLDNAATSQKPQSVIQAVKDFYENSNGNPHRGAHTLSVKATQIYEGARSKIAEHINAEPCEVIFTRNATESLNLVAYAYALDNLKAEDGILITLLEHHSNNVPWQFVSKKTGAKLNYVELNDNLSVDPEEFKEKINSHTKIVSFTMASNVTGAMIDVEQIIKIVRKNSDAKIILDAAQYAPHHNIDVKKLDCDFLAFSGHKMLSGTGIGVLYGKKEILENMSPFMFGGDMIEYVYEDYSTFAPLPEKFEAGTQNVAGACSLSVALDYMNKIGIQNISEYESYLTDYCLEKLKAKSYLDIYVTEEKPRSPVIVFNFKNIHPHDVATILDSYGIAVRSGHHCTQPLHRFLQCNFSCRASFAFYNTTEEIDYFISHLDDVEKLMGL